MAGDAVKFTFNAKTMLANVTDVNDKTNRFVEQVTEYHALRGEAYMKLSARWRDRTGNARNSLHTVATHDKNRHEIIFAHGMRYGIWLEIRFAGRYAIIEPSILKIGPEVMRTLDRGLRKI